MTTPIQSYSSAFAEQLAQTVLDSAGKGTSTIETAIEYRTLVDVANRVNEYASVLKDKLRDDKALVFFKDGKKLAVSDATVVSTIKDNSVLDKLTLQQIKQCVTANKAKISKLIGEVVVQPFCEDTPRKGAVKLVDQTKAELEENNII